MYVVAWNGVIKRCPNATSEHRQNICILDVIEVYYIDSALWLYASIIKIKSCIHTYIYDRTF